MLEKVKAKHLLINDCVVHGSKTIKIKGIQINEQSVTIIGQNNTSVKFKPEDVVTVDSYDDANFEKFVKPSEEE
jgi:hypothetical protein